MNENRTKEWKTGKKIFYKTLLARLLGGSNQNTWGSHLLHPLEAVTFWIASQVGKISNGAILHMGDSVHTPFVWREWFAPTTTGMPLSVARRLQRQGSTQLHNLRFTSPCHSELADHPRHSLFFFSQLDSNLHSLPCYRFFPPSSFTPHAPPKASIFKHTW